MVPLLSAISAGKLSAVSLKTWAACAVAFAGVVVMGAANDDNIISGGDGGDSVLDLVVQQLSHLLHSMPTGGVLIVLAALAYLMHVLRLGAYAPRTAPLRLARSRSSRHCLRTIFY